MGQQPFWTNEENLPSVPKSLLITKAQEQPLSKQQQTFNRLVKKIEKLQADLENATHSLQQKLDFYGNQIYPLEQRQLALHKELAKCLYQFFKDDSLFSRYDREVLGEVITMQLRNIFNLEQTEPDAEFKEIFKAVEQRDYDEAAEEDMDIMKQEMQSMFSEMGVDLDMKAINGRMTEEEIMQKMEDMHNQFREQAAKKAQAAGKKTKKQSGKETKEKQAEEARLKSINSVYKQLVKIFHPDLEQDPDLKLQKEELMKKLNTSYKSGDLHSLLKIELKWIQQVGSNIDKLTDDKLALYNESLKQQTHDLEQEINQLVNHPRYQPLYQFAITPNQIMYISFANIKNQKKALLKELTSSLTAIQGDQKRALAEIRAVIYAFKNYR